jgi:pyruvate/2-oxoglutarate/acetoin dehydrogenase E1 component
MHYPGLKMAIPSTPYDAKGLMKTAVREQNPVLFFEHKMLYDVKGVVPKEDYVVPFGVADVKRKGDDVTVFAYQRMLYKALDAAKELAKHHIEIEIIDPRTLVPLDKNALISSIKKTGRLVVVEEGCKTLGVGAEIAALISDEGFDYLEAPIKRVANPNVPIPSSLAIDKYVIPQVDDIVSSVKEVYNHKSSS